MQIDVKDSQMAIYLENTIPNRDLIAFSAEDRSDANILMNQLRDVNTLRANVMTVNRGDTPDNYGVPSHYEDLKPFGYVGVLKDVFTAPDAIKAWLCKSYKLHKIPIFSEKARDSLDLLADRYGLNLFFVGNERYEVKKSAYSVQRTTMSFAIRAKNFLQHSVDEERVKGLNGDANRARQDIELAEDEMRKLTAELKEYEALAEEKRQEIAVLRTRHQARGALAARLTSKREQMKNYLANDGRSLNRELARLNKEKEQLGDECLRLTSTLTKAIAEVAEGRMQFDLEKLVERWRKTTYCL